MSLAVILLIVAGLALAAVEQWRKTRNASSCISDLLDEVVQEARIGNWTIDLKTWEIHRSREMFLLFDLDQEQPAPSFEQDAHITEYDLFKPTLT